MLSLISSFWIAAQVRVHYIFCFFNVPITRRRNESLQTTCLDVNPSYLTSIKWLLMHTNVAIIFFSPVQKGVKQMTTSFQLVVLLFLFSALKISLNVDIKKLVPVADNDESIFHIQCRQLLPLLSLIFVHFTWTCFPISA